MNITLPAFIDNLRIELTKHFGNRVEVEPVSENRFRFEIISPAFENMSHLARQDEIWKVVDSVLTRDEVLTISLLIAYAPSEIER